MKAKRVNETTIFLVSLALSVSYPGFVTVLLCYSKCYRLHLGSQGSPVQPEILRVTDTTTAHMGTSPFHLQHSRNKPCVYLASSGRMLFSVPSWHRCPGPSGHLPALFLNPTMRSFVEKGAAGLSTMLSESSGSMCLSVLRDGVFCDFDLSTR
jgi:hypothetical protein